MAFRAGLKPSEFDELSPNRIWNVIEAHGENEREEWERARAIAFTAGRYGNSDPKKFPKSPSKFWPFPWDKTAQTTPAKDIMAQHAKMKALRQELEKKNAR